MSPSSIKLTIAQCNAGKDLDLKGCLEMEYRLMMGCMRHLDFEEGLYQLSLIIYIYIYIYLFLFFIIV
jgi:enoyl-CoA hydratase/carnithine racemase